MPERNSPWFRRRWAIVVCFALAALGTHASGLWQPMHADFSCWLRIARDWRQGAALYQETYDNKLPWVYRGAGWLDGARPEVSCYLAEVALATVASLLLRAALFRSLPRLATLVPLLLIVWSGTSQTFYGGQTTEAFAIWLCVIALAAWVLAGNRRQPGWAVLAGAAFFVATALRPPAILLGLAAVPMEALNVRRDRRFAWRTVAVAGLGFGLMLLVFCLDQWLSGNWPALLEVLESNRRYASLARVPPAQSAIAAVTVLVRLAIENPTAVLLCALSAAAWWRPWRRMPRRQRAWVGCAVLWLVLALASAFPGGRHYAHYYHLIWPAVALLSTFWLLRGWTPVFGKPAARRLISGVAIGAITVAGLQQAYQAARAVRDLRADQGPRAMVAEAAAALEKLASPETPALVHVWGDWAELYWRVPRPAPSFSIPHVLSADRFEQWLQATLDAPPAVVVWDGTPWQPLDGAAKMEDVARLEALLAADYRDAQRFGNLRILVRK